MDELPVQAGTYALILELAHEGLIHVGRLGVFVFPIGFYVYLGSARGPGGIRARLGRHLRGDGKSRWHIDYLREVALVRGYGYVTADVENLQPIPGECAWSQKLSVHPLASIFVPRFGASDCSSGCPAHLIGFSDAQFAFVASVIELLGIEIVQMDI